MALRDLNIKNFYSPNRDDDFLYDLYIPSLTEATNYKRLSGYFSSNALAESARGLKHFVLNKGKMQMVLGVIIKEQDQEAIKNAKPAIAVTHAPGYMFVSDMPSEDRND